MDLIEEKAMVQNTFSFHVGNFECLAIRDTIDPMDLEFLFPAVKMADIVALAKKYNLPLSNQFEISNLIIMTGQHTVLIDTGNRTGWKPNAGMLIQNLKAAGISPGDIDTVIISHVHPDHIGGNANSQFKPNYPFARYFIHQPEWDFWSAEPELKSFNEMMRKVMLDCARDNFFSIKDKFTPIKAGVDIIPGFQYVSVPGHTPGHAAVSIASGNERLFYLGDTCHSVVQVVQPDWYTSTDFDHAQSVFSRKQIINRVLSDKPLLFFSHFPFPAVGHIVKKGDFCFWQS
jgi:glyoxylase-like metal-dependent hydrolase (beta-lactamase superfamily II)